MKKDAEIYTLALKRAQLLDELHSNIDTKTRDKLYYKLGMLEYRISVNKKAALAAVQNI